MQSPPQRGLTQPHHQCLTPSSQLHHQYLTPSSQPHHQYLTPSSQPHHQHLTPSSQLHRCTLTTPSFQIVPLIPTLHFFQLQQPIFSIATHSLLNFPSPSLCCILQVSFPTKSTQACLNHPLRHIICLMDTQTHIPCLVWSLDHNKCSPTQRQRVLRTDSTKNSLLHCFLVHQFCLTLSPLFHTRSWVNRVCRPSTQTQDCPIGRCLHQHPIQLRHSNQLGREKEIDRKHNNRILN